MEEERDGKRKICLKIQKGWCIYPLKYNCHLSLPAEELFCLLKPALLFVLWS